MTAKSIENQFTGGKTSQKRIRRSIYDAPHIFFPLSPFPRKNGSICGKRWSINVDRSILEPRRTRSKRRNATATANAPRRRTKADRKRRCRARDTRTVRCRSGACCGSFNRIPNATGASIAELRRRLPLVSLGSAPPHRSAIVSSSRFFTFFFYFFCCRSNPFNSPDCPVFFFQESFRVGLALATLQWVSFLSVPSGKRYCWISSHHEVYLWWHYLFFFLTQFAHVQGCLIGTVISHLLNEFTWVVWQNLIMYSVFLTRLLLVLSNFTFRFF